MKKFSFTKNLALAAAFFVIASDSLFALTLKRQERREIYEYDTRGEIERPEAEEISSLEEIEFPLRRIDYGVFKDDFGRIVSKDLRKEAKTLFEKQEKAKEISSVEEIEMPITKWHESVLANGESRYAPCEDCNGLGIFSSRFYDESAAPQKVVFYDGLGRKISDSLVKDAKKLYEKQQAAKEWASWRSVNLENFWRGFWDLLKIVVYLVVLIFVGTFVWRKIRESKEKDE